MKVSFRRHASRAPDVSKQMKVPYGPSRRIFPRLRWILVLVVATSPIHLFVLHSVYETLRIQAQGVLLSNVSPVMGGEDGVVDTVLVKPGQRVDSGQALALVRPLAQAPIVVDTGSANRLEKDLVRSIAGLDRRMVFAKRELAMARDRLSSVQWLQQRGAATDAEVETARFRVVQSEAALEDLVLQREDQRGKLSDGQGHSAIVKSESENAPRTISSPVAGRVLEDHLLAGRPLRSNELAFVIERQPSQYTVDALVDPRDIRVAMPGRKARVVLPDGRSLKAEVVDLAPVIDTTVVDPIESLRHGDRQLSVSIRLIDSLPPERRIHGLPVRVEFWRFFNWW